MCSLEVPTAFSLQESCCLVHWFLKEHLSSYLLPATLHYRPPHFPCLHQFPFLTFQPNTPHLYAKCHGHNPTWGRGGGLLKRVTLQPWPSSTLGSSYSPGSASQVLVWLLYTITPGNILELPKSVLSLLSTFFMCFALPFWVSVCA